MTRMRAAAVQPARAGAGRLGQVLVHLLPVLLPMLVPALLAGPEARGAEVVALAFADEFPAACRPAVSAAAAFWNDTIVGYRFNHDAAGHDAAATHGLVVTIGVTPGDGPGGVVAGASTALGVRFFSADGRESAVYATGESGLGFDAADLPRMADRNELFATAVHELGHALGIGSLWQANGLYDPGDTAVFTFPRANPAVVQLAVLRERVGCYRGRHALREWNAELGRADEFVPVEKALGLGPSRDSHWNEVDGGFANTGLVTKPDGLDFAQDVMTGWIVAKDSYLGVRSTWLSKEVFVSRTTLGCLQDLGYDVRYEKAGPLLFEGKSPR